MRSGIRLLCSVVVAAGLGCFLAPQPGPTPGPSPSGEPPPTTPYPVQVRNDTGQEVCYLFLSPAGESWGDDRLGSEQTLPAGASATVELDAYFQYWDLKAEDCNHVVLADVRAVRLPADHVWPVAYAPPPPPSEASAAPPSGSYGAGMAAFAAAYYVGAGGSDYDYLARGDCGFIDNDDLEFLCRGDCGMIGADDLEFLCRGDCGMIGDDDLEFFCRGDCGMIGDDNLEFFCRGDCGMINDTGLGNACYATH